MAGRRIDPTRYTDPTILGRIAEQARIAWRLLLDDRVPVVLKAAIPALVALYAVSPIDIIPDFLLGIGQLDDIGVLLAGLALFIKLAPKAVVDEHRAAINNSQPAAAPAAPVVEEWWQHDVTASPNAVPIDVKYTVDGRRSGTTN